jgi:hypothetical protein
MACCKDVTQGRGKNALGVRRGMLSCSNADVDRLGTVAVEAGNDAGRIAEGAERGAKLGRLPGLLVALLLDDLLRALDRHRPCH